MSAPPDAGSVRRGTLATFLTTLISVAALWVAFGPMRPWAEYPLLYANSADALFNLWVVKTVLETGWYGSNPALGAPFGATFLDFAKPEVAFLGIERLAGLFTPNVALVHNLFYFGGFVLVAWSALAVLRRELRISWPLAVAGALLYSWLPYHFARIEHLFLSNYVAVPLGVLLVLRVARDRPPFFERDRLWLAAPAVWVAVAVVASTSIYYGFFTLVLVSAIGVLQGVARRSWRPVASAACVVLCLLAAIVANLSPSIAYRVREGANPHTAVRALGETETYALRPLQLVLPSERHATPEMAAAARRYNASTPPSAENASSALGLFGAAGFLLLWVHLLTGHRVLPDTPDTSALARANAVATLAGIVGGIGTLVALAWTPQFRALNRISVFIAFFAIAALLLAIERVVERVATRNGGRLRLALAVVIAAVGFQDQRPAASRPDVDAVARVYRSDRAFVVRIEHVLPPGAMVYQVPYTPFPEHRPFLREPSYSPMRPYLHSSHIRWSYGGMKGRPGDRWNRMLEQVTWPARVTALRELGFRGVVLDRLALPERGRDYDEAFAALGITGGWDSQDGSLAFYPLEAAAAGEVFVTVPGDGFYPAEGAYPAVWTWSRGDGELFVHNPRAVASLVQLSFLASSIQGRTVTVRLPDSQETSVRLPGGSPTSRVRVETTLRPGWNVVRLSTDQPAAPPPGGGDARPLAFMIREVRVAARS